MELTNRRAFRLRACQACGGDAYVDLTDGTEWRCLQCSRLVPDEPASLAAVRDAAVPRAA